MILNPCVKYDAMMDENFCKNCKVEDCNYAGRPTTAERLEANEYGKTEPDLVKYVPSE